MTMTIVTFNVSKIKNQQKWTLYSCSKKQKLKLKSKTETVQHWHLHYQVCGQSNS